MVAGEFADHLANLVVVLGEIERIVHRSDWWVRVS
jgi:hypothetical protein